MLRVRDLPLLRRTWLRPIRVPFLGAVCGLTLLFSGGCRVSLPLATHAPATDGLLRPTNAQLGEVRVQEGEARRRQLRSEFPERAAAALERLEVVTALKFAKGLVPKFVLRAFEDEAVPYELRASISDGRRRVTLHVNIEPLASGVLDTDRLLLRALADAAFQDAAQRHGSVPRWVSELAGTAAAGELEDVLTRLYRRALEGDADVLRVDGSDAALASQTGAAALILLTEHGRPENVRHLLQSVADGDSADAVMARLAHQPDGNWIRPATQALRLRLAGMDAAPWLLLARLEAALDEAGGAGLEAELPEVVPLEIRDEVRVLRARAAAAEGDYATAARLLAGLSADAPWRLRDPAEALAQRIRAESREGGNARLVRRLALQLDRDFPRSPARETLRRRHPLLGMEEDPQRWLETMRARLAQSGSEDLDLSTLERYTRTLLQDHRVGAARAFLISLGPRAEAPEFIAVQQAVESAMTAPTQAALERSTERLAAWQKHPDEYTRGDVRDTGAAATNALAAALDAARGSARSRLLRLAAETLGEEGVVALALRDWDSNLRCLRQDLHDLAASVSYPPLVRHLSPEKLAQVSGTDLEVARVRWEEMTYALSDAWLRQNPRFLRDMRSSTYAVRQAAFLHLAQGAPNEATPALVARGLVDPAALLRRDSAALAGEVGFCALARRALEDEAWLVREAAARAIASAEGIDAVESLLQLLQDDPSVEVRGAAALGLLNVAGGDARVIDALLATQVEGQVLLRDAIASRLTQLEPLTVARGIERGWTRALSRKKPSRGYLFRTSLLYQRITKQDLRYYPGASKSEIRSMLKLMRTWIGAREKAADKDGSLRLVRVPGADR